jgi:hypothetical protein
VDLGARRPPELFRAATVRTVVFHLQAHATDCGAAGVEDVGSSWPTGAGQGSVVAPNPDRSAADKSYSAIRNPDPWRGTTTAGRRLGISPLAGSYSLERFDDSPADVAPFRPPVDAPPARQPPHTTREARNKRS